MAHLFACEKCDIVNGVYLVLSTLAQNLSFKFYFGFLFQFPHRFAYEVMDLRVMADELARKDIHQQGRIQIAIFIIIPCGHFHQVTSVCFCNLDKRTKNSYKLFNARLLWLTVRVNVLFANGTAFCFYDNHIIQVGFGVQKE